MSSLGASVAYLFEGHPLVLQHLVPSLLNLYTGVAVGWQLPTGMACPAVVVHEAACVGTHEPLVDQCSRVGLLSPLLLACCAQMLR
jgi:hypothetical protein